MRAPLVLVALLLAGCAGSPGASPDVLATFYPLAFVAERLAGDNLTVGTLVPAGVEPHDWEPAPADVGRLAGARVVLAQGAGFEPWLGGLVGNLAPPRPAVVETTASLDLAQGEEGVDPHTWLSPALLAQQATAAEAAMVAAWPEHADAVRARGAALQAELAALDDALDAGLARCDVRVIIANHDAYGYLARERNITVVSLSGLSPEAEPDPDTLAKAIDVAREHNITVVFFEELVSPRVAEVVAQEVGAATRVLSPIESRPATGDYVTLMQENLVGLREAMRCT